MWRDLADVRRGLLAVGAAAVLALPAAASGEGWIAVDVGHTLVAPGAISARGRSEFEFNLDLARALVDALSARGMEARLINADGRIESLQARPRAAEGARLLVSIHHDSVSPAWLQFWDWDGHEASYTEVKRGFGLFVSANNPDPATSLRCASTIGAVLRRNGFQPSSWHGRKHRPADAENGVWYYDNLVVLKNARQPAVLFEAGVIKHKEEELELRDPERQARMADALATGLAACLSVTEISVPE